MKFDDEICKDVSCHECPFNKGEDGCLLAKRLDEIKITPEPCEEHTGTHECVYQRTETHDLVSRRAALEAMDTWDKFGCDPDGKLVRYDDDKHYVPYVRYEDMVYAVKNLPPAQRWIQIKWHDCTDEEREEYGFAEEIVAVFDCDMPKDNQEILVTTSHGYVEKDVCYIDDGFSLDSGYDWIEDIAAWMPLPEPYAERKEDASSR